LAKRDYSFGRRSATHELARELPSARPADALPAGRATTGLHFDDVRKLLEVLHRLTDLGNS